ncbi:MAG: hypothetical protein WCO79_00370 [bacterium]
MNTKPTITAAKVVTAGIALTLLLSASPVFAQTASASATTAQNQAFRPQLAMFEGFSSWFTQFKNSLSPAPTPAQSVFVAPTPAATTPESDEDPLKNIRHGQNVLNRLNDKHDDLSNVVGQLSKQVDDFTARGFDTSKVKVFTDLAQDKLAVAGYDIKLAASAMVTIAEDEQSTNEDIRITLKAADESVRTASQSVATAKTKVRDFAMKVRKESR